jgi:UPF0716 protein FxsA
MKVFAAFLGWPLIEIALFVVIGGQIGLWATLAWVVLSAVLGVFVMKLAAGRQALAMREGLRAVRDPARLAAGGLMSMLAGVMLILPGFLTDAIGLVLLLPPVQALVGRAIAARVVVARPGQAAGAQADIIDGEFTEVSPRREPPSGWTRIE